MKSSTNHYYPLIIAPFLKAFLNHFICINKRVKHCIEKYKIGIAKQICYQPLFCYFRSLCAWCNALYLPSVILIPQFLTYEVALHTKLLSF